MNVIHGVTDVAHTFDPFQIPCHSFQEFEVAAHLEITFGGKKIDINIKNK